MTENRFIYFILAILLFVSCQAEIKNIPKPRTYPRVSFPDKHYEEFVSNECTFQFEKPSYASIKKVTSFFDEKPKHPCWFNLQIPEFKAQLHCSYYPIKNRNHFDELVSDAFEMVSKHMVKANYRAETEINKSNNVSGVIFEMTGPVASPIQLYLTDSTNHFFRASLYYNTRVAPDSMRIIHDFVKKDVFHLVDSFSWN